MNANKRALNNKGFTILELLIATAVFSLILLLCANSIIQIGQIYYKGVTTNRTQDNMRKVADDLAQAIQFGLDTDVFYDSSGNAGSTQSVCLGDIRYTFITTKSLGNETGQYKHVLWKDRLGAFANCKLAVPDLTSATPSIGGEELLGSGMRVPVFSVSQNGNIWSIQVTVSYGKDDTVFVKNLDNSYDYTKCISRSVGGQFCAVSSITSNVAKRL